MNNEVHVSTQQSPGAVVRDYLRTGFTAYANTMRRYEQAADLLDEYFGRDVKSSDLTVEDAGAWLQWMEDRGGWVARMGASRKPGRPAQLVETACRAFQWAERNGRVPSNVFAKHLAPTRAAARLSRETHRRSVARDVAEKLATDPDYASRVRSGLENRAVVNAHEREWLDSHGDEQPEIEVAESWHNMRPAERMAEFGMTEQRLADMGQYVGRHCMRREPSEVPSLVDLCDAAVSSEWAAMFALAGVGGLTFDEMQSLKWWDVRWFEGCLHVRGHATGDFEDGAATQVVEGRLVEQGTRVIPLFEDLRVVLASHFDCGHAEEVLVLPTLRVAARSARGEAEFSAMLHAAGCTDGAYDLDAVLGNLRDAALDRLIACYPSGAIRRRYTGVGRGVVTGWRWHDGMVSPELLASDDGQSGGPPALLSRYIELHGGLPDGYEARGARLPDDYWDSVRGLECTGDDVTSGYGQP